jgi:uncharacterized protein YjfI (DUF2170 family)
MSTHIARGDKINALFGSMTNFGHLGILDFFQLNMELSSKSNYHRPQILSGTLAKLSERSRKQVIFLTFLKQVSLLPLSSMGTLTTTAELLGKVSLRVRDWSLASAMRKMRTFLRTLIFP